MGKMMTVMVNGDAMEVPEGTTVAQLVAMLGVSGRFAVELDGTVIPRTEHTTRVLKPWGQVEVVAAIGGG